MPGVRLCSLLKLKNPLLLHLFVLLLSSLLLEDSSTTLVPSLLLGFSVILLLSNLPVTHLRIDFAPHSFSPYSLDQENTKNIESIQPRSFQIHQRQITANKGSQSRKSNTSQSGLHFQHVQQACHCVGCDLGCHRSSRAS